MKPVISICLPVYNGQVFLAEAIDSVLNQTFADFELLISDDCSTDRSFEIAQQYARQDSRIRCWRNEYNRGLFGNYNLCMQRAQGRFIKPFAQDDVLERSMLATCLETLISDPDLSIVSTARRVIDQDGRDVTVESGLLTIVDRFSGQRKIGPRQLILNCLFPVINYIGEPVAVMFRSKDIGDGFDDSLRQVGDLEYWLRIAQGGYYFYIDQPLANFRVHKDSTTVCNAKQLRAVIDMLRIGRIFRGLFHQYGIAEDEFIEMNLANAAQHVAYWTRAGELSVDQVCQRESSRPTAAVGMDQELSEDTKRQLADLDDLRELSYRALIALASSAGGQSELVREPLENERRIHTMERRLRKLLSSASWRVTRPLRDINRLLAAKRDDEDITSGALEFKSVSTLSPRQQHSYLKYLRKTTLLVLASRSWRITRPLRVLQSSDIS
jgi:glycosyltransferase involved in cell wall biosynthesis